MGLCSPSRSDRPRLYLSVPRDANTHLLKNAVSQLPGCDEVAIGDVASKGQLSASFEHPSSARSAADAIAADRKLAGISVQLISGDSSPDSSPPIPHSGNHSRHDSTLQLPDTLYEGSPAQLELKSHASYTSQHSPAGLRLTALSEPPSCGDTGFGSGSAAPPSLGTLPPHHSHMRSNAAGWSPGGVPATLQVEQRSASASSMPEAFEGSVAAQALASRLKNFAMFQDDNLGGPGGPLSVRTLLNQNPSPKRSNPNPPPHPPAGASASNGAIRGIPQQVMFPRSAGHVAPQYTTSQNPSSGGPGHAPYSAGYSEAAAYHLQSQGSFDRSPGRPVSADDLNHHGPELSRQRLYVVVSKSATEEQIAKLFKRFGGMEYCNLKRDKKTGQSKGFCFVNFSTAESAELAKKALNGIEFPPGSGKPMKVLYSEVLKTSNSNSARHAPAPPPPVPLIFHDTPLRLDPIRGIPNGGPRGVFGSLRDAACLSPGSAIPSVLSSSSYRPASGHSSGMLPPPQPLVHRSSMDAISPGIGGNLLPLRHQDLHTLFADPAVLLIHIQRPLPTYALKHEFEKFGIVLFLQLHDDDGCFAVVKFQQASAAVAAQIALDNTNIVGCKLRVDAAKDMGSPLRAQFLPRNMNYPPAQYPSSLCPSSMGAPSSHGLSSTGSRQSGSNFNPPHSPSSHLSEGPVLRHTYIAPQQPLPAPPPLQPVMGSPYREQPARFSPPFWSNQQGF